MKKVNGNLFGGQREQTGTKQEQHKTTYPGKRNISKKEPKKHKPTHLSSGIMAMSFLSASEYCTGSCACRYSDRKRDE